MLETKPADESDKSLVAKIFSCLLKVSMAAGFHVFLVFAALHDLDKAKGLLTAVGLGYLYLFYVYVGKKWAKQLSEVAIEPLAGSVFSVVGFRWKGVALVKVAFVLLVYAGFTTWLVLDSHQNHIRIRSLLFFFACIYALNQKY